MADVRTRLQEIFRDVFDDDEIVLEDAMTADDILAWDSLEHINLLIATEKEFGVTFTTAEVSTLKEPDQNVGTFLEMIQSKIS